MSIRGDIQELFERLSDAEKKNSELSEDVHRLRKRINDLEDHFENKDEYTISETKIHCRGTTQDKFEGFKQYCEQSFGKIVFFKSFENTCIIEFGTTQAQKDALETKEDIYNQFEIRVEPCKDRVIKKRSKR